MISQTGRYALSILGYLVRHDSELVRGEAIAAATGVPPNYLSKILNQLRKGGFVDSQKGWHGGFRLRASALDRPIREVLATIDGEDRTRRTDCVFGQTACNEANPCPLHGYWEAIRSTFTSMLDDARVADLGRRRED
jgi:Rrf2 family protein